MNKGFFQYIGDSFRILFRNRILLFAGFVEVLFMGMMLFFTFGGPAGEPQAGLLSAFLMLALTGMIGSFMLAGKINMTKKVYASDDEEPVAVGDYFEGMKHFGLKLFGGSMFLIIGILLVFFTVLFILARTGSAFIVVSAMIVLLLLFIFLTLWDTILVVDDSDVGSAYKDSIAFVKKNFWVVLGLNIFTALTTTGDILDPSRVIGNGQEVGNTVDLSLLYQWITNTFGPVGWLISLLMLLVLSVITTMVFVDLYMDRRDHTESFTENPEMS